MTSGFLTYTATPLYVCAVDTGESTFLTSGIWNDLDGWVSSGSYDGNVPNYGTMAKSGTSAETVTLTLNSDGLSAINSAVGSGRFQIALLTKRINLLTEHFKKNKKDNHSRQGMIKLISRRRRLIGYLKKKDLKKYEEIIKKLNLRK